MAQLSKGIALEWGEEGTGGIAPTTWNTIPDITTIPTLIGAPNAIDATTLADSQMVYIEGLPDAGGVLGFGGIMTPALLEEVEDILTAQATKDIYFRVKFPTPIAKAMQFQGRTAPLSNSEVGVNARVDATLNIVPTTIVTWVSVS